MHKLISRALLALTLAALFVASGAPAQAATGTAAAIAFTVPWPMVIALLVSTVLPLFVGLVTKSTTSSAVKAVLLALTAAVTGILTELYDALTTSTTYDLGIGLITALGAFLVAVGLHFGLYKPTGAASVVQRVGSKPLPNPSDVDRATYQAALDERDDATQ